MPSSFIEPGLPRDLPALCVDPSGTGLEIVLYELPLRRVVRLKLISLLLTLCPAVPCMVQARAKDPFTLNMHCATEAAATLVRHSELSASTSEVFTPFAAKHIQNETRHSMR